jgi:nicotinamide riboside transporter PnuC
MFKEMKDERLQLQKYKAGYETFKILTAMNAVIPFILEYHFGYDNPIIFIMFAPFFLGLWIYEAKAQEAEEFDEEQDVLKISAKRRKWIAIVKRAGFVTTFSFITHYFASNRQENFWQSVEFSLISGFGMAIFEYFRMRHVLKKVQEKENVSR